MLVGETILIFVEELSRPVHEITRPGNLALLNITIVSKLRLYNVYILPVLLYGSDTWSVTEASRQNVLMLAYAVFFASHIGLLHTLLTYRYRATNQPIPGFLTTPTTPPQAVWAYSSGCSLRGPLTFATSIHRSPPC